MSSQNMQSDRPLMIAVIFLVVIGLMAIFSASAPKCIDMGLNPARFLIQQIFGVIVGFAGLKFLSNFHYKKLIMYTVPFAIFVIIMLILVKVMGTTVNGAQRWINIGPMSLQPSEFAKPAVVMLLAGAFYKNTNLLDNEKIIWAFVPTYYGGLNIHTAEPEYGTAFTCNVRCNLYLCRRFHTAYIIWNVYYDSAAAA